MQDSLEGGGARDPALFSEMSVRLMLLFHMFHRVHPLAYHSSFLFRRLGNFRTASRSSLEYFAEKLDISVTAEDQFGVRRPVIRGCFAHLKLRNVVAALVFDSHQIQVRIPLDPERVITGRQGLIADHEAMVDVRLNRVRNLGV